jgi:hypothetical protein
MSAPRPPVGLGTAGRRLWRAVVGEFDLHEHELAVLRQAARTADICDQLQAIVERDGPLSSTAAGVPKVHPLLAEVRLQRTLLGRLLVSLRIPLGDEDQGEDRAQYRGTRGFYAVPGDGA